MSGMAMPWEPECRIWTGVVTGEHVTAAYGVVDAEERHRAEAFRRAQDRNTFVVGRALARLVVAAAVRLPPSSIRIDRTCPRCGAPHGKPRIARPSGTGLQLSVSHAGECVAVALGCADAVGIDVEQLPPHLDVDELIATVLAADEAEHLTRTPPPHRGRALLTCWTRKEAVLKALGVGLGVEPVRFSVSFPGSPPSLARWPDDPTLPERVRLYDLEPGPGGGYVGTLAIVGRAASVVELPDQDFESLLRFPDW